MQTLQLALSNSNELTFNPQENVDVTECISLAIIFYFKWKHVTRKCCHSTGFRLFWKTATSTDRHYSHWTWVLFLSCETAALRAHRLPVCTHVSEKTATDGQRAVGTWLQILQEVLGVEIPQFLHVPKNDAALSPEVLGQVKPLHLREIMLDDVAQGANVLPLSGNHLIHDVLHFTGEHKDIKKL